MNANEIINWLPPQLLKLKKDEAPELIDSESLDAQFIGFYFGAKWCGSCTRVFSDIVKFYETINKNEKILEIIFFSKDINEEKFKQYYEEMPWLACPYKTYEQEYIEEGCDITSLPSLLIFSNQGKLVEEKGIKLIEGTGKEAGADAAEDIYAIWLSKVSN